MPETPLKPDRSHAYRALFLSPEGDVLNIQSLIAADDSEAVHLARAMVDGSAVELWDGLRFIEHFPPAD